MCLAALLRRSAEFAGTATRMALRQLMVAGLGIAGVAAHAQAPANEYSYSRASAFTYQANGLLASESVEPDQANLCVVTIYSYDPYGNKADAGAIKAATTANCAGATGLAQITSRAGGTIYGAQTGRVGSAVGTAVPVPAGAFATTATNALNQSETRIYDPRFGVAVSSTGPNALTTTWDVDEFGRKVLETRPDGTKSRIYYCWLAVNSAIGSIAGLTVDTSSNSPGCHNVAAPAVPVPAANEQPPDAVRYEHSVPLSSANAVIGAFTRVYYDRANRKIRTVTQAFDGAAQPGGANRLIVQDTDYNQWGAASVATQPYFLDNTSSTTGGSANVGLTRTDYDALGRVVVTYAADPNVSGQQSGGSAGSVTFGNRGARQAAKTTVAYSGLVTVTTNDENRTRREEKNPEGKLVRVTDASGSNAGAGAQLVHQHDAFGNLVRTKDPLGNVITIAYDLRGRKLSMNDPDGGVTGYCYDALGQLKAQQTSNQRGSHTLAACPTNSGASTTAPTVAGWTTMAYDTVGRVTHRVEPEYGTTWTYDSCTKGVGKLCSTNTTHGVNRQLVYDSLGRPVNTRTDISGGPSAATALSYDTATGRVASQTYPTGVKVSYQYTARGYLQAVKLDTPATVNPLPATAGGTPAAAITLAAGTVLWSAVAVNAWGKAEQTSYANGINNRASYEPQTGRLTNLTAGPTTTSTVVDQRYTWDSANQLNQRIDAIGDQGVQTLDTFAYDAVGRLTQYQVSGGGGSRTVTLAYNALGMLLTKSDVGNYSYPAQGVANGRPHAVQSISGIATGYGYDLNGNAVSATAGKWRSIAYNSFNLPDGGNGIQGAAGTPKAAWQYDENHQRIKEVRVNSAGTRTTWYLHPDNQGGLGFEREVASTGAQSNRHYLSAGGSAFAVLVTTGALPTLVAGQTTPPVLASVTAVKVEYWHKDHLGSLIATTDHAGSVTARYAYDPFGKRRYTNATYDAFGALVVDWTTDTNAGTDRGFTGHEHLDDLGLVHMNGRIYDPLIGRFLQPDPFIQAMDFLDNYDRYAYCMSSPTTCTDPSGYFGKWLASKWRQVWRSTVGRAVVMIAVSYFTMGLGTEIVLAAGASGSVATVGAAAISGFVGGAISSGNMKGALQGAFTGALFAGAGDLVQANGGAGFNSAGTVTNAASYAEAIAIHGVAGCVSSVASGGKCGQGALSAAFSKAALPFTAGLGDGARTFAHAVVGGTASALGGGKFANGAVTGAFSYLFNALQHQGQSGGAGPNERHALGVEEAIKADQARGFELVGRNIGVEINGELRVYDYVIRDVPMGVNIGVEVKTTIGDTVRLSTRQVNLDTDLMRFGGVIVGTVGTGAPVGGVGYRALCFGCDTLDMRSFRLRQQLEFYGIETQRGKLPGIYIPPR